MTTNYPVDSSTRACCGGIGRHRRDCAAPAEIVGARCDGEPPRQEGTTMTTATTTPSWRDFADHLPPHVIQRFERHELLTELHGPLAFPQEDPAEVIQRDQERMLEEAREQIPFVHVPLPAAATGGDLWEDDSEGNWTRVVDGTSRSEGPMSVHITGVQSPDGSVSWSVSTNARDEAVSSDQLRRYAALLVEAADELDALRR